MVKKRYNHTRYGLIFGTDISQQNGVITESKIETKMSFSEFQIPLILQHDFRDHNFFIAYGMEFIYTLANNTNRIIYYGNGDTEQFSKSEKRGFNLSPFFSLGYNIPITINWNISIEPMFKYYLKEYIIFKSHLFNYGLRTTFHF
jgi:hypothetical protein